MSELNLQPELKSNFQLTICQHDIQAQNLRKLKAGNFRYNPIKRPNPRVSKGQTVTVSSL